MNIFAIAKQARVFSATVLSVVYRTMKAMRRPQTGLNLLVHFTLRVVVLSVLLALVVEAQQAKSSAPAPGQPAAAATPLTSARSLLSSGRFKEAESALRAYLTIDTASGQARYLLAYALLRQGRPKESLEEYTRAATLQAPSAADLKDVGQAYVLLNDYSDAERWIGRALEMDRRDPDIWYSLGRLRYSEQRYSEAADCFSKTLVLAPHSVKAENNLGLAYEGMNRTGDAVAAYRQAIAWQTHQPPEKISEQPLLNLAIVLLHNGETEEARMLLTQALAINPHEPRVHEQLGQLYLRQGSYEGARTELEAATRLDPGQSNLHYLLGQAYRRLGRQAEAKTEFAVAARLANNSPSLKPE